MQTTVLHNQTLLDIAIQADGDVLSAFEWAIANGLSITDDLDPGQMLLDSNSSYINTDVADYFKSKKQIAATAMKRPPVPPGLGIGYMKIGINFKVG
jgi:hypothetical protein